MSPSVVTLYADSDSIEQGAIYSNESTWAYATNEVVLSHGGFADVPNLTINLNLAMPAMVLQIAQVDFRSGGTFEIQLLRDGVATLIPMGNMPRYNTHWQNVFMVWTWANTSAGSHAFKVQCTRGTIASRKHAVIVMRI